MISTLTSELAGLSDYAPAGLLRARDLTIDWSNVHPLIWIFVGGLVAVVALLLRNWLYKSMMTREAALKTRVDDLQRVVDSMNETLETYRVQVEELKAQRVTDRQTIDGLRVELASANERIRCLEQEMDIKDKSNKQLVIGIGTDHMLWDDLLALRGLYKYDWRISRLAPVKMTDLMRLLNMRRKDGHAVKYLHFAVHADETGLQFADGLATPKWLADALADVQICLIMGCSADRVTDYLQIVPYVVAFREDVPNDGAVIFTEVYWEAIAEGLDPEAAFERAVDRSPVNLREYVELHC